MLCVFALVATPKIKLILFILILFLIQYHLLGEVHRFSGSASPSGKSSFVELQLFRETSVSPTNSESFDQPALTAFVKSQLFRETSFLQFDSESFDQPALMAFIGYLISQPVWQKET